MTARHLGLIVEDDAEAAEDLVAIIASLDCDSKVADNRQTAMELIAEHAFCFVLLDLQIKAAPDSIRGHIAHGNALLGEIRRTCGANRGADFWTPVLIISGYVEEVDAAVGMMKAGADDIIRKPPVTAEVVARVRAALKQAGRPSHSTCIASVRALSPTAAIAIGVPADREHLRTRITISGRDVYLPDSSLKLLLELAIAREKGQFVHQRELGHRGDTGFKGISRLRQEIRAVMGKDFDIIDKDHHGSFALKQEVVVADLDLGNLQSAGNAEILRLADTLARLIESHRR